MIRSEFVSAVQVYMDAEGSVRWLPETIIAVGGLVSQAEWEGILNQNKMARTALRSVTTGATGLVALSALNSGSGDSTQYFYRVIVGFTDGATVWSETDFTPEMLLATINPASAGYQFYQAGDNFQLLNAASLSLSVQVNHTPPSIAQLAGDASVIVFPTNYEYILVWTTAATLLMKGSAESQAASDLLLLAQSARTRMLGSIGRRTTRPTFAAFQDSPTAWSG